MEKPTFSKKVENLAKAAVLGVAAFGAHEVGSRIDRGIQQSEMEEVTRENQYQVSDQDARLQQEAMQKKIESLSERELREIGKRAFRDIFREHREKLNTIKEVNQARIARLSGIEINALLNYPINSILHDRHGETGDTAPPNARQRRYTYDTADFLNENQQRTIFEAMYHEAYVQLDVCRQGSREQYYPDPVGAQIIERLVRQ